LQVAVDHMFALVDLLRSDQINRSR
jgi:hypothetical protein